MKLSQLNSRLPKRALLYTAGMLFLLSLVTAYYFRIPVSVEYEEGQLEGYIHRQQADYNKFLGDTVLLRKLVQRSETLKEFHHLAQKEYGIFVFAETLWGSQDLIFWNNQKSLPPQADYSLPDGEYFQQLANGYYLTVKKTIRLAGMTNNVVAYAMIPIQYRYDFQQSDYLKTHFVYNAQAHKKVLITEKKTPYPVRALSAKTLFYLERKAYAPVQEDDTITALLRILATVLLLAFVHFRAEKVSRKQGPMKGVLALLVLLVVLRFLFYLLPDIFSFRHFQLFSPTIYAANWFNRSLGDLMINALFLCWLVVFAWYSIGPLKKLPALWTGRWKLAGGFALLFVLILVTFQYATVVRSLIADSKISFYVTDFFSLNGYTVVGFAVLALLALSYYYLTRILFQFINPAFAGRSLWIYFGLAFIGLMFLTLRSGNSIVLFYLPVLGWLVVYTLLFSQEQSIINRFRVTMPGLLFWIFVFSLSLAAIILTENREKELLVRKSIAEKYDQLTDPSSERTLSIAMTFLDKDFLSSNFYRFQNPLQNRYLRDSIISENISSGYIKKYDTRIYVFDSLDRPVNNSDPLTYAELNNLFTTQSRPTGIPDLFYHETSYDQFLYITKREIRDAVRLGTFFIISTPKSYSQDAFYPELFGRFKESDAENSPIYSYAIYKSQGQGRPFLLTSASSKYPFQINLRMQDVPQVEFTRRINGENDELWYRASSNKIVVVAKKQDSFIESITLFSYLFCAFLFMVTLLRFVSILLKAGNDWRALSGFWQFNIRSQIQGIVVFVSILSFLIIGVATISFFIKRYQRNNIDKLSRTAGIMVKEMEKQVQENEMFDDVVKTYDSAASRSLQKLVDYVADVHDVNVNVYDPQGNLQVSSEAEVYEMGILSNKMHPEAFYHLNRLRQVQYVQQESMSSLRYLSIYAAIRNEEGEVYAYLNIPYFLSQFDLNQEISNFLVTIINLNAFIFLIAGVIALFITNRITRSFSLIGDKMKEVRLGKTNEEIVWNRNDEIGELVEQYNKMVRQLEQSAEALAKSEREGAWREMARQVAHEIKNPLTPMKLSIQYLQRAINNNQPNVKQLTSSVADTLIEQIDHLSKIAADFSRFANIGNQHIEIFDLHDVLESLKDLYSSNPKVELTWKKAAGEVMMSADKTHMNRLFTNLLTNAIDACQQRERCRIVIEERMLEDGIRIQIWDNGEGIPREMQARIFSPNFTTKSSGTGLGLAMCKSIVEQAGGRIWFETAEGEGTTFFVELPRVK